MADAQWYGRLYFARDAALLPLEPGQDISFLIFRHLVKEISSTSAVVREISLRPRTVSAIKSRAPSWIVVPRVVERLILGLNARFR
jgi:hypothetical protein